MAILKCKICGGDMSVSADKTFGTCEYCGSTMTLPKIDDEQRADAFNRGNHFRRIGEFDKALSVYERIVEENPNDAEAHWCCALCRFGIEWVEDPVTMEYLPTCHRASFDIFTNDVDYLAAVELSSGITQKQYKRDAAKISEVQKGILATSQNEKPFDVFICYKESDENGNRTVDSTLAQDIYYQLTEHGLRVFFARITLEDKVGSEYEPYIFAALNSAKVMVAVGTKPEHFNAVWVKNEWSRFLSIVKHDRSKVLLPCYKDMDPYDLPEQLAVLQSYDMSKIGFIQDLIRGIKKICDKKECDSFPSVYIAEKEDIAKSEEKRKSISQNSYEQNFKAATYYLKQRKWYRAKRFFKKCLFEKPDSIEAIKGAFLSKLKISSLSEYPKKTKPQKTKEFNSYFGVCNNDEKNQINKWLNEAKQKTDLNREKIRKTLNKTAIILTCFLLAYTVVLFVIIPLFNYYKISDLIKKGKVEQAVEYYYSSNLFNYESLIEKKIRNTAETLFAENNYEQAYELYKYSKKENNEKLYLIGCELVKQEQYETAKKCFLQIYKYKDSKQYYDYCKGRILLTDSDLFAYKYLSECKGFLDADELICNSPQLKLLDDIQGEWYYSEMHWKDVVYASIGLKRVSFEDKYILIVKNNLLFDKGFPDYYRNYINEEILKISLSENKLFVLDAYGDVLSITVIDNKTMQFNDKIFKKSIDQ